MLHYLREMLGTSASAVVGVPPVFLTRFTASPPVDEISSATGTLVGNATADTANSRLTCDGTGDWCTFPASTAFNLNGDFTVEVHCDAVAGEVGGIVGHMPGTGAAGRWAFYCNGDGTLDFYADNVQALPLASFGSGALNGSEHHFALVHEGTNWRSYRDGVQKSVFSHGGDIGSSAPAQPLYIGTDPFSTTARDINAHIGRVKITTSAIYPGGTTFTPPSRTVA